MKQILLKTLALGLMVMLGVKAWAQTTPVTVNGQTCNKTTGNTVTYTGTTTTIAYTNADDCIWYLGTFDMSTIAYIEIKAAAFADKSDGTKAQLRLGCLAENTITSMTSENIASKSSNIRTSSNEILRIVASTVAADGVSLTGNVTDYVGADFKVTATDVSKIQDGDNTKTVTTLDSENSKKIQKTTGTYQLFLYGNASSRRLAVDQVVFHYKVWNNNTSTPYSSLSNAFSAASSDDVILIGADEELSARVNTGTKTLTIKPVDGENITIKRASGNTSNLLMLASENSSNLTIDGSESTGSITIDNNNIGKYAFESSKSSSTLTLNKITIKNAVGQGAVQVKTNGKLILKDVTFEDCTPAASADGVVFCGNSGLTLQGNNVFTGGSGANIYIQKGYDIVTSSATNTTPITIKLADDYEDHKLSNGGSMNNYRIVNKGWLMTKPEGNILVSKITDSYPLTIGSAGMATLVLPFNVTTLPTGVTAYDLTTDYDKINATSVSSITKDKPVLIVADAGTHTFTGAATADYSTDAPENGCLVGTYNAIDAADGNFVLQKHGEDPAAFYKLVAGSNHVINPFRAYLKANGVSGTRSIGINFGDGSTGIAVVNGNGEIENVYYNLQGQRVNQPGKGIYIVNGKKVLIK